MASCEAATELYVMSILDVGNRGRQLAQLEALLDNKWTLACPYCDHPFDLVPSDGTGCPHCGETIYVYDSPLRNAKIILTDEGHVKIVKAKAFKPVTDYFTSRMLELEAAFGKAKATTSHYAELGRELESLVRCFLSEYLPNKY